MAGLRFKKDPENGFDPANLPHTLTPIPHITGTLDTSGTADDIKVHEQIDLMLNYHAANYKPTADVIENPPGDRVTEDDARGLSEAAATDVDDLDKDTVGGQSLSDGFKDPNDQLEEQTETDVDQTGTPLGGEEANVADSHEDDDESVKPYTFDEVYPEPTEADEEAVEKAEEAPVAVDTTDHATGEAITPADEVAYHSDDNGQTIVKE